ncbi:endonuclease III [Lujinxingia sediminis]|uniref:Endonuclease III n=2 Tax=Lujinxingia sediminis TaxID=2480984 RepID=A0ABY0CR32_9DELT|nr:endonuclease III [Lujinxingia sediminis]
MRWSQITRHRPWAKPPFEPRHLQNSPRVKTGRPDNSISNGSPSSEPPVSMYTIPDFATLRRVLDRLYHRYDPPRRADGDDVLGTLVRTILSQQTTRAATDQAFGELLESFNADWHRIAYAPTPTVEDLIRPAGLARQKAQRIQALLIRVHDECHRYDLEHLHQMEPEKARTYLLEFKGVGPKTAAFTLMAACAMPLFPMDTHIFRIFERLGWLDPSLSDEVAHQQMQALIPPDDRLPAHMALVEHGRTLCRARSPLCERCPILRDCPTGSPPPVVPA